MRFVMINIKASLAAAEAQINEFKQVILGPQEQPIEHLRALALDILKLEDAISETSETLSTLTEDAEFVLEHSDYILSCSGKTLELSDTLRRLKEAVADNQESMTLCFERCMDILEKAYDTSESFASLEQLDIVNQVDVVLGFTADADAFSLTLNEKQRAVFHTSKFLAKIFHRKLPRDLTVPLDAYPMLILSGLSHVASAFYCDRLFPQKLRLNGDLLSSRLLYELFSFSMFFDNLVMSCDAVDQSVLLENLAKLPVTMEKVTLLRASAELYQAVETLDSKFRKRIKVRLCHNEPAILFIRQQELVLNALSVLAGTRAENILVEASDSIQTINISHCDFSETDLQSLLTPAIEVSSIPKIKVSIESSQLRPTDIIWLIGLSMSKKIALHCRNIRNIDTLSAFLTEVKATDFVKSHASFAYDECENACLSLCSPGSRSNTGYPHSLLYFLYRLARSVFLLELEPEYFNRSRRNKLFERVHNLLNFVSELERSRLRGLVVADLTAHDLNSIITPEILGIMQTREISRQEFRTEVNTRQVKNLQQFTTQYALMLCLKSREKQLSFYNVYNVYTGTNVIFLTILDELDWLNQQVTDTLFQPSAPTKNLAGPSNAPPPSYSHIFPETQYEESQSILECYLAFYSAVLRNVNAKLLHLDDFLERTERLMQVVAQVASRINVDTLRQILGSRAISGFLTNLALVQQIMMIISENDQVFVDDIEPLLPSIITNLPNYATQIIRNHTDKIMTERQCANAIKEQALPFMRLFVFLRDKQIDSAALLDNFPARLAKQLAIAVLRQYAPVNDKASRLLLSAIQSYDGFNEDAIFDFRLNKKNKNNPINELLLSIVEVNADTEMKCDSINMDMLLEQVIRPHFQYLLPEEFNTDYEPRPFR